ncbi:hypothetical protein Tco_0898470 [Tanacetum coccineum]
MCMFALTVSTAEPKNIKEAMADSAWIEAMQEELHQFDRLQVWKLVDKPLARLKIGIASRNHFLQLHLKAVRNPGELLLLLSQRFNWKGLVVLDYLRLSKPQILWGVVPPKIARKFKKPSPSKKDSDLVLVDEEPVTKSKRVKRSIKKSSTKPAAGVVIREAPVETKSKSKDSEKVDVTHGKGIKLLSEVALTEEAQMKEVRKKSLRDFHKTHPSGSGTVAEKPQSVDNITPTVISEGTGDKPGVPDVTEDDSTESESEPWGNDEDDNNNEQESSNEGSEQENESDEQESNSEQEVESKDDDQER